MTMKLPITFIALLLLCPYLPRAAQARSDLRVGVLYTGDPYPGHTPYIHMKVEPMLVVTPVQASRDHYAGISGKDILRAIRVYMPRTYEALLQTYDVVIISDSNVGSFTIEQLKWFKKGVGEDGLGLVMIGGHETFGSATGNPDWGATPVGDVLPVDTFWGEYHDGKVEIVEKDHEFIRSLPWRPDLDFLQRYASNIVEARPGTKVLARSKIEDGGRFSGYENPFFSTWEFQEGRTFAMTGDWTPGGGVVFLRWEYLPDFATNLMLYCAKRTIPEDLDLVHTVRTRLASIGYRRIIIDSLVDFVEKFGANPKKILAVIGDLEEVRAEAAMLYLEQDFDEALAAADRALELMDEAEHVSDKVKDDALLWVYLTEWLTVSGTCMVVAFVLWTLMIRRGLYREVRTTSFRKGG